MRSAESSRSHRQVQAAVPGRGGCMGDIGPGRWEISRAKVEIVSQQGQRSRINSKSGK